MIGAKMDYKVELVAQAFYEADQEGCRWDNEPAVIKEQFGSLPATPFVCSTKTSAFFFSPWSSPPQQSALRL
jgi:hypothetical protein